MVPRIERMVSHGEQMRGHKERGQNFKSWSQIREGDGLNKQKQ